MPYKPNHFTGWYHCIVRFNRRITAEDVIIQQLVCQFQLLRSQHPFLIVHHDDGCGDEGVSHTHFLYKHYKQCQKTHIIRKWAEKLGAKEYFKVAGYPLLLREYLVSGGGRHVVHEVQGGGFPQAGDSESNIEQSWAEEAEIICKPDAWECIEPEGRGSGARATQLKLERNRRGIYGREQQYDLASRLRAMLNKYPSKDQPQFYRRIKDKEDLDWYRNAQNHVSFDKIFTNEIALIKMELKQKGYIASVSLLPDDPKEYDIEVMTIGESLWWIRETLTRNNINQEQYVTDAIQIMTLNNGKRNTLYHYGPKDCGKSTLEASLTAGFFSSTTLCLLTDNSSGFIFEDLVRAGVCVLNEPAIAGKQVEFCKLLLEGCPFSAEAKYKSKEEVVKLPVIVTTNKHIWVYAPGAEGPIRSRIAEYIFTVPSPPRSKPLHPKVWLTLANYYGLPKRTMSRNIENSIDVSEFGLLPTSSPFVQTSAPNYRIEPERPVSPPIRDRSHDTESEESSWGEEETESEENYYDDPPLGEAEFSVVAAPVSHYKRHYEVRILTISYISLN